MRLEVFRDLSAIPATGWDALVAPGHAMMASAFLGPCERTLPGLAWRPIAVSSGDRLIAAAPAFAHAVDLAPLVPATARRAVAAARRLVPSMLTTRVLELGQPCCPGPPMIGDPGAFERIVRGACELADGGEADVVAIRDFAGAGEAPGERLLRELGFAIIATRDTFALALALGSFDAYLDALRAPYRRRARHALSRALRVRVVRDFAHLTGPIAHLIGLTTARSASSRREQVDPELIGQWAGCAATAAILIESDGGELLVVGLVLEDAPVVHFVRCGFDERVGRASGGYLRLLYELIRFAVERGHRVLDLGSTSAEPKLRLGAQPVPLRVWARHRGRAGQAVLRRIAGRRGARAPQAPRHVFREPPPPIEPFWYRQSADRSVL